MESRIDATIYGLRGNDRTRTCSICLFAAEGETEQSHVKPVVVIKVDDGSVVGEKLPIELSHFVVVLLTALDANGVRSVISILPVTSLSCALILLPVDRMMVGAVDSVDAAEAGSAIAVVRVAVFDDLTALSSDTVSSGEDVGPISCTAEVSVPLTAVRSVVE
jgi:hypothetical protein